MTELVRRHPRDLGHIPVDNMKFKVRNRPMYVIRGAWNAQAPETNRHILGYALEQLPMIPSILVGKEDTIFFGTPGQCTFVKKCGMDEVIGIWGRGDGYRPIYKKDITTFISVPSKKTNPYPKKYELDRDNICRHIDYDYISEEKENIS